MAKAATAGFANFALSRRSELFLGARKKKAAEPSAENRPAPTKGLTRGAKKTPPPELPPAAEPPPPSAVRPSYAPGADEAVQLANTLRDRLAAVRQTEDRLAARQKYLDLIHLDLKRERDGIDTLRKQVASEMKAVDERMAAVEQRYADSQQKLQENTNKVAELQKNLLELQGIEQVNVKKMAQMYDTIDPESGARILQQLANSGKMDTAVELIGQMRERQAAKVLAALPTDSGLAAQFLERLKGLKRPTRTAQAPTPAPAGP
jgi:flagellar motility protein MotE (MotC chaperone)